MTFSLRRKRPTTHRVTNTSAPKGANRRLAFALYLPVLALALVGTSARAQQFASAGEVQPAVGQNQSQLIVMTKMQRPRMDLPGPVEDMKEYQIQLTPPAFEKISRTLETERQLQERMRQEARERPTPERIYFPREQPISTAQYTPREFAPFAEVVEPCYVCYGRLYFQDKNAERYGWDFGFVQPVVSTCKFWWDVAWLPYHMGTAPCRRWDSNAGQCMPGDPVPYLIYPPDLSVTGAAAQAGTVLALFAVFPGM